MKTSTIYTNVEEIPTAQWKRGFMVEVARGRLTAKHSTALDLRGTGHHISHCNTG